MQNSGRGKFKRIQHLHPKPLLQHSGRQKNQFELYDFAYQSTDHMHIEGWALIPAALPVNRIIIVGHGYGGCEEPEINAPLSDAAYLFPCFRGISRSRVSGIPEDPTYHVLYNIDDRDRYILGGCVEDLWLAVSAAEKLFPAAKDRIGFMGISFSGGIGSLALPWDNRIRRAHFQVPSFGHQSLRLELPTQGSGRSVQNFYKRHPQIIETLNYYDAAVAARHIDSPVHVAPALA